MITEPITIDQAIQFLNSLVKIDPGAIETRTLCTKVLAEHPSVQIAGYEDRMAAAQTTLP